MARGILDALMRNPRGWGPSGPATPEQPSVDYPTTGQFTFSGQPIPDMSQMPMFGTAGPQAGLHRIAEENAPEALALAAGPLGRLAGPAIRAYPAVSAALLGGAGASIGGADAGDAGGEAMEAQRKLIEQKERLSRQLEDATARQNQNRPKSMKNSTEDTDPNYWTATKEVRAISDQIGALDKQIEGMSPERVFERAQDQQRAELDKPFAARNPTLATGLAVGAPIASALLAGKGMSAIAGKGNKLLAAVDEAKRVGDVGAMREGLAKLGAWRRWVLPKQAAAIAAPATLPMDARVYGDVVDKFSLPETSKAQQRASAKLRDIPGYIADSEQAVGQGLIAAMIGGKIGSYYSPAPRGDAGAMMKLYGKKDAAGLANELGAGVDASAALAARRGGASGMSPTSSMLESKAPTGASPTTSLPAPSEGYRQIGPGSPTTSRQTLLEGPGASRAAAPNAPSASNDAVTKALMKNPSKLHHSNFQPRKQGLFKKGKPRFPAND
jgi:hypothetical protein